MAVDETEDGVVEGELDHHSALPAIAKHVLHYVVLTNVTQEPAIIFLHKDDKEDLTLANKINFDVVFAKIALYQSDFFIFFSTAFLTAKSNDVVAFVVGEHRLEVDTLRLPRMVPSHGENVQVDIAHDQVPNHAGLVLLIRRAIRVAQQARQDLRRNQVLGRGHGRFTKVRYLEGRPRPKQLMQLHELEDLEDALELEDPFRLERKQDLDPVAGDGVLVLVNRGMNNLHDFLIALHSHLRHEALIVLQDVDG